jgi:hypothetical protein
MSRDLDLDEAAERMGTRVFVPDSGVLGWVRHEDDGALNSVTIETQFGNRPHLVVSSASPMPYHEVLSLADKMISSVDGEWSTRSLAQRRLPPGELLLPDGVRVVEIRIGGRTQNACFLSIGRVSVVIDRVDGTVVAMTRVAVDSDHAQPWPSLAEGHGTVAVRLPA